MEYLSFYTMAHGVCLPASCDEPDILENFNVQYGAVTHNDVYLSAEVDSTMTWESLAWPITNGTMVYLTILGMLGSALVLGTLVDVYIHLMGIGGEKHPKIVEVLQCFSLYTNASKILSPSSSKPGEDHLDCLNGMRVLAMFWIVLGHTYQLTCTSRNIKNREAYHRVRYLFFV